MYPHSLRMVLVAAALLFIGAPAVARASEAVQALLRLPLPERQTAEHHAALARAAMEADAPGLAAEAIATLGLLDATGQQDVVAVRRWLGEKGEALARAAKDARAAGDRKRAVKAQLSAVKCLPELLGRDDDGATAAAFALLERVAEAHPERCELRFQVGLLAYLQGRLDVASAAFRVCLAQDPDAYRQWRARTWLARTAFELSQQLETARQERAAADARSKKPRGGGQISFEDIEMINPLKR